MRIHTYKIKKYIHIYTNMVDKKVCFQTYYIYINCIYIHIGMVSREISTTRTKFPKISAQLSCVVAKYDGNSSRKNSSYQRNRRPDSDGVEVSREWNKYSGGSNSCSDVSECVSGGGGGGGNSGGSSSNSSGGLIVVIIVVAVSGNCSGGTSNRSDGGGGGGV